MIDKKTTRNEDKTAPAATSTNTGHKPIFIMALPACRGRAIGDNAIRRAVAISEYFTPVIISNSFPDNVPEIVRTLQINPPVFNWLHRFCHVPNELGFAWSVRKALMSLHRHEKIGFLLCHGYSVTWFAGRWFRHKTGVAFGMFMHGHIFERPQGTYDSRVTAFYRAIAPTCYRESDILFSLSPAQAELAMQAGAKDSKVVVAPNGLDFSDIGIQESTVSRKVSEFKFHQPLRLLYVGRLSVEKGCDIMLRACTRLHESGIEFHLRVIGDGPEKKSLMKLVDDLKMPRDIVEFYGSLQRFELGEHYLSHDLLIVPSTSEPLGNVVLEGMAGGCVIVASNTGGIPSMVTTGKTGYLFETGSELELFNALHAAIIKRDFASSLVNAGLKQVLSEYNWRKIGRIINETVYPMTSCP